MLTPGYGRDLHLSWTRIAADLGALPEVVAGNGLGT
jgi:hypothetical protein